MSIFNDKSLKSVAEAAAKIMEASAKKADKDYDKDGKIESPKDEVWGSRLRAAKLAGKLKEEDQLEEGGMPSSVIKHKQRLAAKTPEELHAGFKEVADRMGKSVEHVARSLAWSHGYGKGQGQGSSHYYDKVKHLEPKSESVELDEAFPTVADGEKSLKAKEGKTSKGTLIKTKTGVRHERDYDDTPEPEEKRGRGRPTGSKSGAKKRLSEMRQEYLNYFEEVDNATFTKELEDQKAKFDGKKKGADVAKPAVQAVKQEEVEQMDEVVRGTVFGKQGYRAPETQDERNRVAQTIKGNRAQNRADTRVTGYGNKVAPQRGVASADTGGARGSAVNVDKTGQATDFEPGKGNIDPKAQGYRGALTLGKRSQGKGVTEEVEPIDEVAPPGREDQVKALKKVPGIDNPYAVSWASYRKSHPKKD